MKFTRDIVVRFEHCDAAGLMFYPRFYALVNEMVEDWFAVLGRPFAAMHVTQRKGVPTVKIDAQFERPARMGERLRQQLHVAHLGHSSCRVLHEALVDNKRVAWFEHTIVFVDLDTMKAEEWPLDLRAAMIQYLEQI
ncbi:MAG: hotdog domain-containing protein [Hyphomonadaceae bacterium]